MSRVVVIGAGVGGLAAAARLASAGHHVTICEQSDAIGGKLGRYQRDGFTFDTGPSLLTMPQVFTDLFATTGDPLDTVLTLRPVEPIARYRFADGTQLDLSGDVDIAAAELDRALGRGAGDDWRRLRTRAARIWDAVEEPFLRNPIGGARGLLALSRRVSDLAAVAPHRTVRQLGQQYLHDPRLRKILDRYATYTGSDPRRAPAALASVLHAEHAYGGWYVDGGLYRLGQAIADRAQQRGATLRLDTDVTAITVSGGRVAGVTLKDGQELPADLVVTNADAAHLYRDLLPQWVTRGARRRLAAAPASLSGFVLLLGVRGHTPDHTPGHTFGLAHHNVFFPADYDAEFNALFGPDPGPISDPTIYVAVAPDPAVAPPGDQAWFVLVNAVRADQWDWDRRSATNRYADRILNLLAARGVDIRDRIIFRELRTPADLARRTRAEGGAIYGTSSNGPTAAFLRPPNIGAVPGLFLVGGSSHPGGGLPLVALSAEIVANVIGPA